MIIDNSHSDIKVVGDIKEFKTSIDPKNLEFITTLLSSNLYSDPEQSFIREIVSNAWDSHVEAGTTNTPVIIKFGCGESRYITIRDYGTGLSPERFKEVYCNIGSSTKRESNEFIGGFGIGKYSSLACSNTVYITSYYEGTAYYYIMVKSGNSITTNLVEQRPTTEKNGVEVTIKNINFNNFEKALSCIVFFPNIYIVAASNADSINNTKIKRFKNFAAASMTINSKLLLGNVLYPCNNSLLSSEARAFMNDISNTGIAIKFDVGELNITPNRENIIYSSDTVNKINDRILAAKKELHALIDKKVAKDYDDIIEYANMLSRSIFYYPITDEVKTYTSYHYDDAVRVFSSDLGGLTYKGVDLKTEINKINNILGLTLPNFKGIVYDDRVYNRKPPYAVAEYATIRSKNILVLNEKARLISSAKVYLRKEYNNYGVITAISLQEFEKYVMEELGSLGLPRAENFSLIISGVYDSIMNKAKKLDLDNDPEFLKFKDDLSSGKCSDIVRERDVILHVWQNDYRLKHTYKSIEEAVKCIKEFKKGIVLTGMDVDTNLYYSVADVKGYVFIQARKDIIAELKELNLKCLVDIDWLFHKDPNLSVIKTIKHHFPNGLPSSTTDAIASTISGDEGNMFTRLRILGNKYGSNFEYMSLAREESIPLDPYTDYLCQKLKKCIENYDKVNDILKQSGYIFSRDTTVTAALVIKTKAYRVNAATYKAVRENQLIRVLCRK